MLRVFEAFAGYGSQRMALRNIGIPHEVVGISEIVEDAILAYASIHTDFLKYRNSFKCEKSRTEQIEHLEAINVPLDYKTFKNRAKYLNSEKLNNVYLANILSKNYGDITKINPQELPDFDLFTYSFPCQDISVAGYQKGLDIHSETRSSLLWECCKIIETKRPRYLMMENVKNLIGTNHRKNFHRFLKYLESLGYTNRWDVLNARDFGIPQNRERVFCISSLEEDFNFKFPLPQTLKIKLQDILEDHVNKSYYLKENFSLESPIQQKVSYCIDSNYWKGSTLESFLTKHRRQLVTDGRKLDNGNFLVRRLTQRETWRLMGCTDCDFDKASSVVSKTNLYKLAGNSIVVSVLEAIFKNLFLEDSYKLEDVKKNHQFTLF